MCAETSTCAHELNQPTGTSTPDSHQKICRVLKQFHMPTFVERRKSWLVQVAQLARRLVMHCVNPGNEQTNAFVALLFSTFAVHVLGRAHISPASRIRGVCSGPGSNRWKQLVTFILRCTMLWRLFYVVGTRGYSVCRCSVQFKLDHQVRSANHSNEDSCMH